MTASRRLPSAAAAVVILATTAVAVPAAGVEPRPRVSVLMSCDQTVGPGHFACQAARVAGSAAASATPSGYGPADIQSAYGLPGSPVGDGQTVWIIDAFDNPHAESDLGVYRSHFGLPPCTTSNGCFDKLNQDGRHSPLPRGDLGWAGEIALDLAMVSATCPACKIRLVEANDTGVGLFTAIRTAATNGARFISLSWGSSEWSGELAYDQYLDLPGVVVTAATGDGGYLGGMYPSSSSYVVAVGGTSLTGSVATGWTQTAWGNGADTGSGSGCSSFEAKPPWQTVVPSTTCTRRAAADVSAVADPLTGVAVYQTYGASGWTRYGGTSAATPIIASVYALAGKPGESDRPARYLYEATSGLRDVTSGSTGVCGAATLCHSSIGWDGPTGLGTPNGITAFTGGHGSVTITDPGTRALYTGVPASVAIHASDTNLAPVTFAATGLPPGLSIGSFTGVITGIPTTAGTYDVTVTAQDGAGLTDSKTFAITVTTPVCPGQILLNPGFESGSLHWSSTAGVLHRDRYARTGSRYSNLDGYGRTRIDMLTRKVPIAPGCKAALSYYVRVLSDDRTYRIHDTLTVYVNGRAVSRLSNLNRSGSYRLYVVDVSRYAGTTITVGFRGYEDASVRTSFQIDDTGLTLRPYS